MSTLLDIAKQCNGYVTSGQATEAGIPRRKLTEAINTRELIRIERGLYALPDIWEDQFLATQHRFSRGIYSDDTALFLHNMTDRSPFSLTMTFPRSYNASPARNAGITCRTCADAVLELGVCDVATSHGNTVKAYDLERTLCDLVRGQQIFDFQIVTPAMQAYVRRGDRNIVKLLQYARSLGVEKKIRAYLQALL
ncbi:type IV toxin-antitoxin system AbiEi family antitoxin domain-containing protein [uncultured Actinomyces sp.]|uniref:type IV toxin-antitoxin system AbiEi family antitoxin domain-containing protein n=1 Tax=uncultured Actinomyces sp. TaxID=249061 RepID=UPI00260511AA|nr:type IV toxin-antitoxin system AbiEi family antitoxin domain-containing protein [uncultured Actinomyces sp.]